jgi:transposase
MREQLAKLSRGHDLSKAFNYILKRWASFALFLEDGRVCLSNNAAERGLRGIALGRKSWLFCGSDRGGRRAAAMYSLIVTAKMNGIDPQAWLTDILVRIATHPVHRLDAGATTWTDFYLFGDRDRAMRIAAERMKRLQKDQDGPL